MERTEEGLDGVQLEERKIIYFDVRLETLITQRYSKVDCL